MNMTTDTEIKLKGIEALIAALGEVQAERFVSLIMREPFDYTVWQRNLWSGKSVEEISRMAMSSREYQPTGASDDNPLPTENTLLHLADPFCWARYLAVRCRF